MSALLKNSDSRLDLAMRATPAGEYDHILYGYNRLMSRCVVGRDPPLTPQAMSKIVRTEKRFTGKADCDVVDDMYGDFFEATAPTVERLVLQERGWGEVEACALAEALPRFVNCRKLVLFRNPLGDAGAKAIFEALDAAPSVQELGMIDCNLGEGAAVALAAVLQRNTSLTNVSLSQNDEIGDAGGLALAEAIGRNATLRELDFDGCDLGENAEAALRKVASMRAAGNELRLYP